MADSTWLPYSKPLAAATAVTQRHHAIVRLTHWLTTLFFFLLLLTGIEILISHPRFYWGEAGNVNTPALFKIPIPASRATVPTGYAYTLPDQNGWSRYLHFQAAWGAVFTGLLYLVYGAFSGHFRKNLLPSSESSYKVLQGLTYLAVIFVLFPLVIWTGLAMSPGVTSALPFLVTVLGGQQSARTIHFFVSILLVAFLIVHIVMICLNGFTNLVRGMITGGQTNAHQERP
jgi:thiosulfate reductase cytochrome b subunit